MSSEPAIKVSGVSKVYRTYARPLHRLAQAAADRAYRLSGLAGLDMLQRRYYGEFAALKDVSLEVAAGECLGILGRNGAGKTTLLEIIAGTVAPTAGEVWSRGAIGALLELGSGFSSEFTGRENVYLNAALLGMSRRQIEERLPRIEEFAEIGDFIDQPVKTYSSGMVLRLAFSVHVALEPSIMIVDEALAVGDARFQRKCYRRLEEFKHNGGTIIFVTHDMGLVTQICDRAVVLEQGRIFYEGDADRATREYHRLLFSPEKQRPGPRPEAGKAAATQTASREVRYGSGEAQIKEIFTRNAQGRVDGPLQLNGEYEFVMRVAYQTPIQGRIAYGFIISNVQGIEMYGVKSALFARSLPPAPDGAEFECVLRLKMMLAPGTYFLTCALSRAEADDFLDYRFDATEFNVVGQPRCFTTSAVDLGGELYERELTTALRSSG